MMAKTNWIGKILLLLLLVSSCVWAQELPDGFAVWSEGSAWDRTITYRTLKSDGTMGEPVVVVKKGELGGDIQSQISFDGKWLSFSRSMENTNPNYGGNDYHVFDKWEVYVARLDGSFPTTPIKVGRGYWPSWGDDSYGETKTLYYSTHHDSKTIRKVTINSSGVVDGTDKKVYDIPAKVAGQSFRGFAMIAPNGKWMAWRGSGVAIWFFEDFMGQKAGTGYAVTGGCHPSISSDSRWLFHAGLTVARVGQTGATLANGGKYHFGTSQDLNWFMTKTEGGAGQQNTGQNVKIFPVKIKGVEAVKYFNDESSDLKSADYVPYGNGVTVTDKGQWPDVHVWSEIPADTTLRLNSTSKTIKIGEKVELTASLKNEKGEAVTQPINWTVNGGGSLASATGTSNVFTSDGTAGKYAVTVKSGAEEDNITITVYDPANMPDIHIKINSGGPDVDDWKSGSATVSGGSDFLFSEQQKAPEGEYAAPELVYQTVRHQDHSYTFPDIVDGDYTVRIHFTDQSGGRSFEYDIEGTTVLTQFDPTTDVGKNQGSIKSFNVTVSDGNGLTIDAKKGSGNDVFESAIEIISGFQDNTKPDSSYYKILSDHTGKEYSVGDIVEIKFEGKGEKITGASIAISTDGRNWAIISGDNSINPDNDNWGNFKWKVTATAMATQDISLISDKVRIKVMDYVNDVKATSGLFTITEVTSNKTILKNIRQNKNIFINLEPNQLMIDNRTSEKAIVSVFNLFGKRISTSDISRDGISYLNFNQKLSNGKYFIRVKSTSYQKIFEVVLK